MDIRRLRCFLAVAEAGHITRAAQVLGMQQPPLSQQIRMLETELGLALFTRHPKGVTLTDAGRELRAEARRIVEQLDQLQQRMQRVAAGRRGVLAVGFTSSAAAHAFTPRVLRESRARFPEVELQISESNAAEIIEAVAAHRLHFGFLRVPVDRPEGVLFEQLLSEPAVLVLPVDHPLARRYKPAQAVPLQALAGENLILVRRPNAPGLYANLLARLEQAQVPVRVVAEVERMMSNINLVASGTGISIVPASMQGAHPQSVVYRPLPRDAAIEAPITLAWHRDTHTAVSANFGALVRQIAAEMAPQRQAASRALSAARRRASG
jgi:DNA-binding transcriptional LysR family regulator